MLYIKASIYTHKLSEQQRDLLRITGFIADGSNIWNKTYEVEQIVVAVQLLCDLLDEIEVDPYRIELDKFYFTNILDKYQPIDYNAIRCD